MACSLRCAHPLRSLALLSAWLLVASTLGPGGHSPPACSAPAAPSSQATALRGLATRVGPGYQWWCYGRTQDVQRTPKAGLLLAGGGDGYDEGMRWFERHANEGDVVVLRASGDASDDVDKRGLAPLSSLQTILVTDRSAASDPFVLQRLRQAEGIFISGGDQSRYIRFFKGTPLAREVEAAAARGVPVGGTSAGLAILGEFSFTARYDTVTSEQAFRNPRSARIDLERAFLSMPFLEHVITDTHFKKRDRMGRLLVFMAHLLAGGQPWVRALAVDEGTAMVVEGDGKGRVVGRGATWCLQAARESVRFAADGPCLLRDVEVQRVAPGQQFDLGRWQGEVPAYRLHLQEGRILSTQGDGAIY